MKSFKLGLFSLLLSLQVVYAQRSENNHMDSRIQGRFFLGTHLFRYPMPEVSELKADMDNLKRHGFNLIKIQTHWAIDEPIEGQYNFERYEELIKYAEKLGMNVYLGLTLEHAPAWLYNNYPEVRMVGKNGQTIMYAPDYTLPTDGKPGPCFDHPIAMEKHNAYINAIVSKLSKYKNIVVWNTWQEIGHWPEMLVGQPICYCTNTLNHFRAHLKNRYGDLKQLNDSWKTNFGAWDYVVPNRGMVIGTGQDVDWRNFIDNEYVASILKARYAQVKKSDPLKRPVFAHKASSAVGSGVDWTYAKCQDFLGTSSYPAWSPFSTWDDEAPVRTPTERYSTCKAEMWNSLALNFDYIRSANPLGNPIWAAEFQGGPIQGEFRMGRVPSPDDIRRWMLTAVGSGVTAISFWVTRAEMMAQEDNGFGLLNSEGDTTPRFEEASRIGSTLIKYPDLFGTPNTPLSKVAIIVDESNRDFTASYYNMDRHLAYSMRGWHRLLWDLGIAVDFISIDDVTGEKSKIYKALVLPFPVSLSNANAEKLSAYVSGGGNLISEAAIGRFNEMGISPRGELSPPMRAMFGIRQMSHQMIGEPGDSRRWMPNERGWGEVLPSGRMIGIGPLSGSDIQPNYYIQTYEPLKGTLPILKFNDQVVGTVREVGKGKAWMIGSFVGHNGTAYKSDSALKLVEMLMNQCNVYSENFGNLSVRRRVGKNREAWILTNATQAKVTESIDISNWRTVKDLLGTDLQITDRKVTVEVESLDVRVLILER